MRFQFRMEAEDNTIFALHSFDDNFGKKIRLEAPNGKYGEFTIVQVEVIKHGKAVLITVDDYLDHIETYSQKETK